MKDPLDKRIDAYRKLNDEAARQKRPGQVSPASKHMEVLHFYGRLKARTADSAGLLDAHTRLTRVEKRLVEDMFFYMVEEKAAPLEALVEPEWLDNGPFPAELPLDFGIIRALAPEAVALVGAPPIREAAISPSRRYDEPAGVLWPAEFDR
jgi:hypothetical protein